MKPIDRAITILIAAFFGFAGVDKILHLQGFINAINDYAFLPVPIGPYLAPIIIAAELMVPVGLSMAPWRRAAALQASLLMVIFTLALIGNKLMGGRGICGCWFSINMAHGNAHLLLNGILTVLSVLLWRTLSSKDTGASEGALGS